MNGKSDNTKYAYCFDSCVRACVRVCFENTDNISVTLLVKFTYGNKPSR